jgi:CheY-like chemotaxis protein/HPt (histidine-containing phosphotransfer) domain-containing protein
VRAAGVHSGAQALALLQERQRKNRPPFGVVILDWKMPEMDGWETARRILSLDSGEHSAPHFIMVSANGQAMLNDRPQADQALLSGFLAKPVSPEMLLEAIHRAFSNESDSIRQPASSAWQGLTRMRILVVEDNLLNQQVAEELLSNQGALVSLAANGRLGVDAVAAANPQFDVVLMDLQMPVMDGFAATKAIREQLGRTTLPIIAMSANVLASDRAQSLASGMNDHIGKPFEIAQLVALLRQHLGWADRAESNGTPAAIESKPVAMTDVVDSGNIDFAQALVWMGGSTKLYCDVAGAFLKDLPAHADSLERHLASVQPKDAARVMHTLKGLARTVGAVQLAAFAAHQEKALQSQVFDSQSCNDVVQLTRIEIEKAGIDLTGVLSQLQAQAG